MFVGIVLREKKNEYLRGRIVGGHCPFIPEIRPDQEQ